ncbi:hypothetical protein M3Y99_00648100 [Aphelenchoides fujianensis]|nr:hypothetical protein M3Y99_00648100 [Aphelenchoides fujianensis]
MGKKARHGPKANKSPASCSESTDTSSETHYESGVFDFGLAVLLEAVMGVLVGSLVSVLLFVAKRKADVWGAYTAVHYLLLVAAVLLLVVVYHRRPSSSEFLFCVYKFPRWMFACSAVYFVVALLLHWAGVWTLSLGMIAWMAARTALCAYLFFRCSLDFVWYLWDVCAAMDEGRGWKAAFFYL